MKITDTDEKIIKEIIKRIDGQKRFELEYIGKHPNSWVTKLLLKHKPYLRP